MNPTPSHADATQFVSMLMARLGAKPSPEPWDNAAASIFEESLLPLSRAVIARPLLCQPSPRGSGNFAPELWAILRWLINQPFRPTPDALAAEVRRVLGERDPLPEGTPNPAAYLPARRPDVPALPAALPRLEDKPRWCLHLRPRGEAREGSAGEAVDRMLVRICENVRRAYGEEAGVRVAQHVMAERAGREEKRRIDDGAKREEKGRKPKQDTSIFDAWRQMHEAQEG